VPAVEGGDGNGGAGCARRRLAAAAAVAAAAAAGIGGGGSSGAGGERLAAAAAVAVVRAENVNRSGCKASKQPLMPTEAGRGNYTGAGGVGDSPAAAAAAGMTNRAGAGGTLDSAAGVSGTGGFVPAAGAAVAGVLDDSHSSTLPLLVQLLQPAVTWHTQQIHAKLATKQQQQQQQVELGPHSVVQPPFVHTAPPAGAVGEGTAAPLGLSDGDQLLVQPLKGLQAGVLPYTTGAGAGLVMFPTLGAVRR
jgi:hypothetical protein